MDRRFALSRSVGVVASLVVLATSARGQCLDWSDGFGLPGVDEAAYCALVHDDGLGGGPALYVGGQFRSAGAAHASGIARWTGSDWEALGSGLGGHAWPTALALVVHDDGSGPALFVGGSFFTAGGLPVRNLARWDGAGWSAVGGDFDGDVKALAVYDDGLGSGPCLFVGGLFTSAGGTPARNLARWDGWSWSEVGGGVPGPSAAVHDLVVLDLGAGPALYVGGEFTHVGATPAANVARWNGQAWAALGAGTNLSVRALTVHGAGGRPALYAGGEFTQAGGKSASRVARWDGGAWSALGAGVDGTVRALGVHDDGSGAALVVGGQFGSAGGLPANGVALWRPSGWSQLGGGLLGGSPIAWGFASFAAGGGSSDLIVCGGFPGAGTVAAPGVAAWDGLSWTALGDGAGLFGTQSEGANALAQFDDGSGPAIYAGGVFGSAGTAPTPDLGLARWDGSTWSALPPCPWLYGRPKAMAVVDPGTGPGLWVGASGSGAAMWNGSAWDPTQSVGTHGSWGGVRALLEHDDGSGSALYVGGWFTDGCLAHISDLIRWDGAVCSSVGAHARPVNALVELDDGGGPVLVAAGQESYFPSSGYVASWDGAVWTSLGGPRPAPILALAVFDDGAGPALYAGGGAGVERWSGVDWVLVGDAPVTSLAVHDDGTGGGPALYAAGSFGAMAQVPASSIARWDGSGWSALGLGIETDMLSSVACLGSFDDGTGARLWAGGNFAAAGGRPSVGVASWGESCGCTGTVYCTSKVSSLGCVPSMGASGISNLSSTQPLMLFAAPVPSNGFGLLFYGKSGADALPFLGGTLCVRTPILRAPAQWSGGNPPPVDCSGSFAMDFKGHALSGVDPGLVAGASVHAQYWYRDPNDPFGSGTTDAVAFLLCP